MELKCSYCVCFFGHWSEKDLWTLPVFVSVFVWADVQNTAQNKQIIAGFSLLCPVPLSCVQCWRQFPWENSHVKSLLQWHFFICSLSQPLIYYTNVCGILICRHCTLSFITGQGKAHMAHARAEIYTSQTFWHEGVQPTCQKPNANGEYRKS